MNTQAIRHLLRLVPALALSLSMGLGRVSPADAALRCYVKADAGGSNTGSSWTNAFTDLQSALGASPCTEVWVAAGIYRPTGGTDRAVSFQLKNNVALYGGFAGNETLLTQRNPVAHPTILSGQIGAAGSSDNTYHVVVSNGVNGTAILDGFSIRGGYATNGLGGAGMWILNSSTVSLRNLIFSGNRATFGAGIYNEGTSRPSLTNVTFSGNSATNGAGMYNYTGSNAIVTNATFSGNSASGGGGGLFNYHSSPTLTNVTLSGNLATNGAGMFNETSSPILTNVTSSGNSATNGGGMYNFSSSSPIMKNGILYGDAGGEILNDGSTASVQYSIVEGGYPGTGNLDANPLLKPLGSYGGFTRTQPLGLGSPAIDKGTNTSCPLKDQRGVIRPQDGDGNGTKVCDMGATESRLFVKSFQSIGAQDGWVLESTETSGVGGKLDSIDQILIIGDSKERQQGRSILSFNTSSLPDKVQLVSAVLKLKKQSASATDPFTTLGNLLVDVRKGAFSSNAALQLTDFQALANKNAAVTILNNPVNGWYSRGMPPANLVYINTLGLTQFRLRFQVDDNNDGISDYIKFYSGNYLLTPAWRPQLVVKYYVP